MNCIPYIIQFTYEIFALLLKYYKFNSAIKSTGLVSLVKMLLLLLLFFFFIRWIVGVKRVWFIYFLFIIINYHPRVSYV